MLVSCTRARHGLVKDVCGYLGYVGLYRGRYAGKVMVLSGKVVTIGKVIDIQGKLWLSVSSGCLGLKLE